MKDEEWKIIDRVKRFLKVFHWNNMSARRKLNLCEKLANMFGVLYRYHAREMPRRLAILKDIFCKELAPPKPSEFARIKKDVLAVNLVLRHGEYKNYTVREALVYGAIVLEIMFWFFIGEAVGRRNLCGYIVPRTYISKATRRAIEKKSNQSTL
uniref:ATP synthase protein MI25 n=1 Tax=Syphacia muris TaxID=451379 RepID=A0A0N5AHY9_9BILA